MVSDTPNHQVPDTAVEDKLETVDSAQETPDQQLEQPLQNLADPLDTGSSPTPDPSSESELDSDMEDVDVQEFCAHCFRGLQEVTLRRRSRCMLSFYCSVKCQRENWRDHKVACSFVAAHIQRVMTNCVLHGFISQ